MIKIFLVAIAVMLTSCVMPIKNHSSAPNIKLWQQHLEQVKNIHQWDIRGRVSIQTKDDGGPADMFWRQTDHKNFDIKLVAPFGGSTLHLQGQPAGVLLTTSEGEQVMAQTADELIEQIQGWHFPVSGLRYWLLGMPSPSSQAKLVSWNNQGLLYVMHQDGWRIEMRKYKTVANKILPRKLFISRLDDEEVDVRLVIREWGLAND